MDQASRLDGFLVEFYQMFWKVIKNDIMAMFVQLKAVELDLYKLNFRVITLLPKKREYGANPRIATYLITNASFIII